MVRAYKGSHSGEHGDGIVRSEFHEKMFGAGARARLRGGQGRFDPNDRFNPGKIVHAPDFDDRTLFRYGPDYHADEIDARLDWSAYPGAGGGFQGAVEMCNNNGACRALAGGVMCPSYRVTRDERDVTRGRANTLRLAITGQLGPDALTSDEMAETLKLCVSCKACRRECPTGVDMARMKIEVQAARVAKHGLSLRDRLVGYLPRYAPFAARWPDARQSARRQAAAQRGRKQYAGLSARRSLPRWRSDVWREPARLPGADNARGVVFFADTFNRYFEPENIEAALGVLTAAGYARPSAEAGGRRRRPLCCGRTFLAVGLVDEARREAERCVAALSPFVARGMPVVGLEPSCMLGFRDELPALVNSDEARRLAAHALLFEEFLAREAEPARSTCRSSRWPSARCCTATATRNPSAPWARSRRCSSWCRISRSRPWRSSCCGMAGAFGYGADTIDVSLKMAELSLLPAVRKADARYADRRRRHLVPASDRGRQPGARRSTSRACWR